MCDPLSAAAAAAAVLKAGAQIGQGVSDYKAGQAQQKAYTYQGQAAVQAANIEAGQIQREGDAHLGQMRAIQASSGTDIATGSPADVAAESAKNIELDRLTRIYGGRLEQYDAVVKGKFARAKGSAALTQGIIGGASTLLTSGAQGDFGSLK